MAIHTFIHKSYKLVNDIFIRSYINTKKKPEKKINTTFFIYIHFDNFFYNKILY